MMCLQMRLMRMGKWVGMLIESAGDESGVGHETRKGFWLVFVEF
jgi:hypothetical protein